MPITQDRIHNLLLAAQHFYHKADTLKSHSANLAAAINLGQITPEAAWHDLALQLRIGDDAIASAVIAEEATIYKLTHAKNARDKKRQAAKRRGNFIPQMPQQPTYHIPESPQAPASFTKAAQVAQQANEDDTVDDINTMFSEVAAGPLSPPALQVDADGYAFMSPTKRAEMQALVERELKRQEAIERFNALPVTPESKLLP